MNLKLYEKMLKSSIEMQGELKKNGEGFKYKYFKTEDIIPKVLEKCAKYKFGYNLTFKKDLAEIHFFDLEQKEEAQQIVFSLPINVTEDSTPDKSIQLVGKMQTYYIRYLLIQAFNICEADLIEMTEPKTVAKKKKTTNHPLYCPIHTKNMDKDEMEEMVNIISRRCEHENRTPDYEIDVLYHDAKAFTEHDKSLLEKHFDCKGVAKM